MNEFLQNRDKLVILGIGNQLRGDDYLGSLLAQNLSRSLKTNNQVTVIDSGVVPENFTGVIKKENPTHIILIDAADMKKQPGYIKIIKKNQINDYNISTHAMPLSFLIKYFEHFTKARIILIGIQPKEMELADHISEEIKESMEYLMELFIELV